MYSTGHSYLWGMLPSSVRLRCISAGLLRLRRLRLLTLFVLLPLNVQAQDLSNDNIMTVEFGVPLRESVAPASPSQVSPAPPPGLPTVGLVLSGGGARGLSQVGVLLALEEAGIRPDFVVGTSIGAIVGGLYASGYTPERLRRVIRDLDWQSIMQLTDEANRSALSVDQKPVSDRSILTLRLDGLQPMLPVAVSNGQRLTNVLNGLALQGIWLSTDFDNLMVPYRAVATDLLHGRRVVLSSGSLAEAMRASATIPVMYAAVARDSMLLVDGGIVSNFPIDVAEERGCDIIIAVNTVSPLRTPEQIGNPLETLDQVFNVMMREKFEEQTAGADFVIEPDLGTITGTQFELADSLISAGYTAGKRMAGVIRDSMISIAVRSMPRPAGRRSDIRVLCHFPICDGDDWFAQSQSLDDVLRKAMELNLRDDVRKVSYRFTDNGTMTLRIDTVHRIAAIEIIGSALLSEADIAGIETRWLRSPWTERTWIGMQRYILEDYRTKGYSLAEIDSISMSTDGLVRVHIREGRIGRIIIRGNTRTNRVVLLRELPLSEGEVFRIADLNRGMENIAALNLFHYVTFDIERNGGKANLIIRVVERPSQMLQTGLLVDNERNAQIGLLLRDANLFGSGTEAALSFFTGAENRRTALRYTTNRLFYTPFSLSVEGYYSFRDYNSYTEVDDLPDHRFAREVASVYRSIKYGGATSFGLYVERFGNLLGTLRYEQQQVRTDQLRLPTAEVFEEDQRIISIGIGSTIDTQDRYPYPQTGLFFTAEYVSAQTALGSDLAFSRLSASYELYIPLIENELVVHPRFMFGYGDKTMPRSEEFRIGGLYSFMGMRENEFNGRQIAVGSMEFRYRLPIDILFDSYLSARYDLGRTWANPELVRIQDLRHGAGLILGLDTPIGPADFSVGKSFYFLRSNPSTPIRWGSTVIAFSIGVEFQ
ncbi:MAG: BamA/TamA family outer membrane protein, partial [Bacteroidetes bacterium]|nr:BamA/TamA family outer membrane protein [Bacteroidota bacterium]